MLYWPYAVSEFSMPYLHLTSANPLKTNQNSSGIACCTGQRVRMDLVLTVTPVDHVVLGRIQNAPEIHGGNGNRQIKEEREKTAD